MIFFKHAKRICLLHDIRKASKGKNRVLEASLWRQYADIAPTRQKYREARLLAYLLDPLGATP